MADLPRLNGVIRALEEGRPAFTCFSPAEIDSAYAISTSKYDGVVYEMEHNPWDGRALRDALQYMLNRSQIVKSGSVAPAVTPMVRVPVNGIEKGQWHAKQSLDITTPYFLPDDSLKKALIEARKRGVRVCILVPGGKSDHMMTRASSRRSYGDLLLAGVEISEYQPAMIHAKIMIVDGVWSIVGSTNFDNRSFGINDEVNLAAMDPQLAASLTRQFEKDLGSAKQVSYDQWKKRSVWERMVESVGWLLERQQ